MTTHRESPYLTAAELGIAETERQKLIDVIPVLLDDPEFNMADWQHCAAHHAKLGHSECQMSQVIFWNLCCSHGKCWTDDLASRRSGPIAARVVARFLAGSELDNDGKPKVIKNRMAA